MRAADNDTPSLPEDAAALRALLRETRALVDTLVAERDALASQNERLQHLLLKLKRRQFGTKSERLPEEQLLFAFEEIEATLAGNAAEGAKQCPTRRDKQAKRRRAGRGRLPAHLPRIEQVLAPEATACPCCQGPLVEIGIDAAERLDVIPAQFRVVVTKRPKLACRACPGVVLQAPAPARLVEGGMPTEATVAHVLVSRYADHLYVPGRGAEHAKALLGGYKGILQCDGYGAYKTLAAANDGIMLAFCWSHVRREFIELAKGKAAPIAQETLKRIAALYAVETELPGKPPDLRRAGRQERCRPLIEALFAWLSAQLV